MAPKPTVVPKPTVAPSVQSPTVAPSAPLVTAGPNLSLNGLIGIQATDAIIDMDLSSMYFGSVKNDSDYFYQHAPATTSYGSINNAYPPYVRYDPAYFKWDWNASDNYSTSYVVMHTMLLNQIADPNASDINAASNIIKGNFIAYCTDKDYSYWADVALQGALLSDYRPVTQLTPDMQAKIRWIVEHSLEVENWQEVLADVGLQPSDLSSNNALLAAPFQTYPTAYPNGQPNGISASDAQSGIFNGAEAMIYYCTQLSIWELLRGTEGNPDNGSFLTDTYWINPYANPDLYPSTSAVVTKLCQAILDKVAGINDTNYGNQYTNYRPEISVAADQSQATISGTYYHIPVSCTQVNVIPTTDPHVVTIQPDDQVTYTVTADGGVARFDNGSTSITANYSDTVTLLLPLGYTGPVSIEASVANASTADGNYYYLTEIGAYPMDESLQSRFQAMVTAGFIEGRPQTDLQFNSEGYSQETTLTGSKYLTGITSTDKVFSFTLDEINVLGGSVTNSAIQTAQVTGAGSFSFELTDLQPGDHRFYRISEQVPNPVPRGWTYDTNYYDVSVWVSTDGVLSVTYYLNGLRANIRGTPDFTNAFAGPRLPDAGGVGVIAFILMGALMMLLPSAVFIQLQRRREYLKEGGDNEAKETDS